MDRAECAEAVIDLQRQEIERLRAELAALEGWQKLANEGRDKIETELRAALVDARELIEFWASYASDYFKEKHGLAEDLARIDAALKGDGDE